MCHDGVEGEVDGFFGVQKVEYHGCGGVGGVESGDEDRFAEGGTDGDFFSDFANVSRDFGLFFELLGFFFGVETGRFEAERALGGEGGGVSLGEVDSGGEGARLVGGEEGGDARDGGEEEGDGQFHCFAWF